MVKRRYEVDQAMPIPIPEGPRSEVYENPTFSKDDSDKDEAEVGVSHVITNDQSQPTTSDQSQCVNVKSQLTPMAFEPGDKLRLGFLIVFPLTMFIVAVIVTGAYV